MRNTVFILYARGRYDEAIALMRQAVELDPLSAAVHCFLTGSYRIAGRLDGAETAVRKALALSPHGGFGHFYLSDICLAQGRLDESLEAAKREINGVFRLLALANVYQAQGRHAESDAASRSSSKPTRTRPRSRSQRLSGTAASGIKRLPGSTGPARNATRG